MDKNQLVFTYSPSRKCYSAVDQTQTLNIQYFVYTQKNKMNILVQVLNQKNMNPQTAKLDEQAMNTQKNQYIKKYYYQIQKISSTIKFPIRSQNQLNSIEQYFSQNLFTFQNLPVLNYSSKRNQKLFLPIETQQSDLISSLYKAILAFKIIRIIANSTSKQIVKQIYQMINNLQQVKSLNQAQVQMLKDAKDTFLGMFFFKQGKPSHTKLVKDLQVACACEQSYLVYHPTCYTQEIFKILEDNGMKFIQGNKGIGKSLSLILATTLFSYIADFKLSYPNYPNILKYGMTVSQWQKFNKIPKLFYFSFVKSLPNGTRFFQVIKKQLPFAILKEIHQDKQILTALLSYKQRYKMKFMVIFDHIDIFYSQVKQAAIKKLRQERQISLISDILNSLSTKATIFISKESIQNQKKKVSKLDILYSQVGIDSGLKTILLQWHKPEPIEISNTILFQLKMAYHKMKRNQGQQFFQQINKQLIHMLKAKPYLPQITHSKIVFFLSNYSPIDKIQKILSKNNNCFQKLARNIIYQLNCFIIKSQKPQSWTSHDNMFKCLLKRDLRLIYNGIIAFKVIQFIKNSSAQDISAQKIIQLIKKCNDISIDNENLELRSSIDTFLGMFTYDSTIKFSPNAQIYDQTRFKNALCKDRLIYRPTITTKTIFNRLNYSPKRNQYIHGQAGIGKSISMSLATILHNHVQNLRENINPQQYKQFCNELMTADQWKIFDELPKIFYFSLSFSKENSNKFFRKIKLQLPTKIQSSNLTSIQALTAILNQVYECKDIGVIFLIDQINVYYSKARECFQNQQLNTELKQKNKNQSNTNAVISSNQKQSIQLRQQLIDLWKIILQLGNNNQIIFGCSQNVERNITKYKNNLKFGELYQLQAMPIKIEHELYAITQKGIKDTIQTIKFQIENRINESKQLKDQEKKPKTQRVNHLFKKFYESNVISEKNQQLFCLSQLTHQRINSYMKNSSTKLPQFDESNILTSFYKMFQQIHKYNIELESQKYLQFMKKGLESIQVDKFNILINVREKARQQLQNGNKSHHFQFNYEINQELSLKFMALWKQHACYANNTLDIYYSPETFLKITDFTQKNFKFLNHAAACRVIIKLNVDNRTWLGATFDNCVVAIMTKCNYNLKIKPLKRKQGHIFFLEADNDRKIQHNSILYLSQEQDDSYFQAFTNLIPRKINSQPLNKQNMVDQNEFDKNISYQKKMQGKTKNKKIEFEWKQQAQSNRKVNQIIKQNSSIYLRFHNLFVLLEKKWKFTVNKYICAAPSTKNPDRSKYDSYFSLNSQVVDFLLIKNNDAQKEQLQERTKQQRWDQQIRVYNLRTFDLSVSFEIEFIKKKINKAIQFFNQFLNVYHAENTKEGKQIVNSLIQKRMGLKKTKKDILKMKNQYRFPKIEHNIVVPFLVKQRFNEYYKGQSFSIRVIAIQEFEPDNVNILKQNQTSNHQGYCSYILSELKRQLERISRQKASNK